MTTETGFTIGVCLVACGALLLCDYRDWKTGKALLKIIASTAFLTLAVQLDATASVFGRLILSALALSWLGDVFLLSQKSSIFLLGLASFLLAHVAFCFAFAVLPVDGLVLLAALVLIGGVGAVVLAWLWGHLKAVYRVAVTAYVAAIVAMCAMAVAAGAGTGVWLLALGAMTFAISDIAVARDRFVARGAINRLWGLPLYYTAQIFLALSVGVVHASVG